MENQNDAFDWTFKELIETYEFPKLPESTENMKAVAFFLPKESVAKYRELQKHSNEHFSKFLKSILVTAIDKVHSKL